MISHEKGIFEFTLDRSPGVVGVMRRSALDFLARLIEDREVQSRLEVAIHEMLENSVKYSTSKLIEFRLQVTRSPNAQVIVTTCNHAGPSDIAWLRRAIDRFEVQKDPAAQYQRTMQEASRTPQRSRLGLARIRMESGMKLSCTAEADGKLTIQAKADLR